VKRSGGVGIATFFMKWWLHSGKVVEELLRKGEIRVAIKWAEWEWWKELSYEDFVRLKDIEKETFKIVSKNEKVPSNPKKWKTKSKNLFPENWTYEEIAGAMKKAEEKIKDVLLNKYGLPEYSIENAGKKWKYVKVNGYPVWEIKMEVEVNAKKIELEVWWRYDENGKLDYTIYTFYPAK